MRKAVNVAFAVIVALVFIEILAAHHAPNEASSQPAAPKVAQPAGGTLVDASTGQTTRSDSSRRSDVMRVARTDCTAPSVARIRRYVTRHPDWADDDVAQIACSQIHIGMAAAQVRAAWGAPESINSTINSFGQSEQWVYGGGSYVYLDNGVVTSLQQSR